MVTRREFCSLAMAAGAPGASRAELLVPIQLVLDSKAQLKPEQIGRFWSRLWPEAVRDFARCGIRLQSSLQAGEVGRPPGREPVVSGLATGAINLVITDQIPIEWNKGRALCGVATLYRGRRLCMIALSRAHGHEIPLLSVNTCVHELLHVLLGDIFEKRPKGPASVVRELKIDWYATRLWVFGDGGVIRRAAAGSVVELSRSA